MSKKALNEAYLRAVAASKKRTGSRISKEALHALGVQKSSLNASVVLKITPSNPKMAMRGTFMPPIYALKNAEKLTKAEMVKSLSEEFSTHGGAGGLSRSVTAKNLNTYPRAIIEILWADSFGRAGR